MHGPVIPRGRCVECTHGENFENFVRLVLRASVIWASMEILWKFGTKMENKLHG